MKYLLLFTLLSFNIFAEDEENTKKRFIDKVNASFEISQLKYSNVDNEYEIDWGFEFSNSDQEDFEIEFSYANSYDKTTDSYSGDVTRDISHEFNTEFDVNNIWKIVGYTSNYSVSQQKENGVYLTKYDATIAPLGIKLDIYQSDLITELTLSFLPTYHYLETDDITDDSTSVILYEEHIERSLDYTARLEIGLSFFKGKLTISEDASYARVDPFDDTLADTRDFTFNNDLSINFNINDYISFSYQNTIAYDNRRKIYQDLASTNQEHMFSLSFNWSP
jgi:hypothetical protein